MGQNFTGYWFSGTHFNRDGTEQLMFKPVQWKLTRTNHYLGSFDCLFDLLNQKVC
jgi:hypothetical protein